jgi:hypothetical protein
MAVALCKWLLGNFHFMKASTATPFKEVSHA